MAGKEKKAVGSVFPRIGKEEMRVSIFSCFLEGGKKPHSTLTPRVGSCANYLEAWLDRLAAAVSSRAPLAFATFAQGKCEDPTPRNSPSTWRSVRAPLLPRASGRGWFQDASHCVSYVRLSTSRRREHDQALAIASISGMVMFPSKR